MAEIAQHDAGIVLQNEDHFQESQFVFDSSSSLPQQYHAIHVAAVAATDSSLKTPTAESVVYSNNSYDWKALVESQTPLLLQPAGYHPLIVGNSELSGWERGHAISSMATSRSDHHALDLGGLRYSYDVGKGTMNGGPLWPSQVMSSRAIYPAPPPADIEPDLTSGSPASTTSFNPEPEQHRYANTNFGNFVSNNTWSTGQQYFTSSPACGVPQFGLGFAQPYQTTSGLGNNVNGLSVWDYGPGHSSVVRGFNHMHGPMHAEMPHGVRDPTHHLHMTLQSQPVVPYAQRVTHSESTWEESSNNGSDSGEEVTSFRAEQDEQPASRSTTASATATLQRKREDAILLEGKRLGLTYKQIRKRMGTSVAESTLRGRYRALIKPRSKRVRKPVWTDGDMILLKEVVTRELERDTRASLTKEQRLTRISWKRVAEYILTNGGSYQFGNSTCKKKWLELDSEGLA